MQKCKLIQLYQFFRMIFYALIMWKLRFFVNYFLYVCKYFESNEGPANVFVVEEGFTWIPFPKFDHGITKISEMDMQLGYFSAILR